MNKSRLLLPLFGLFIVLFSLGQLTRVQLAPDVALYAHDIIIALCVSLFVAIRGQDLLDSSLSVLQNRPVLGMLAVWVLFSLSLATLREGTVIPLLYATRYSFYGLGILALLEYLQPRNVVRGWLVAALLMLLLGLLQYLILPDMRFLRILGWDDHYYRLIGSLFDPGFTGLVYVLGLNTVLLTVRSRGRQLGLAAAFALGIALTFSRATYLALAVSLGGWALYYYQQLNDTRRIARLGAIGLLCVVTILVAPKPGGEGVDLTRTSSIAARAVTTETVLSSLTPIDLVVGQGLFSRSVDPTSDLPHHARFPDNLFVLILTQMGAIGLILFAVVSLQLGRDLLGTHPQHLIPILAVLIHSQFNNSLLQPFIFLLLWGIVLSSLATERDC